MSTLRIITHWDELIGLQDEWRQLLSVTRSATIFQTPEWVLGWRETPNNATPFCIAILDAGCLVGFILWQIEKKFGTRVLKFIGTPLNDSNRVLVDPRYTSEFDQAIVAALKQHSHKWDALHLTELDAMDALSQIMHLPLRSGGRVRNLHPTFLPTLELPPSWELYWKQLSAHRRKRFNYSARHLETAGALKFHFITAAKELARELPIFSRSVSRIGASADICPRYLLSNVHQNFSRPSPIFPSRLHRKVMRG